MPFERPARTYRVTSVPSTYCSSGYENDGPAATRRPLTHSWYWCDAATNAVARTIGLAPSLADVRT
jgi:hypothetical protein